MKLNNKKIELETNDQGEISSIKFEGQEILHDGSQWWAKTFPVIWPVVGVSTGFEVDGENYEIPKHGFWKELNWDGYVIDNKITLLSMFIKNEIYPWTVDITQRIKLESNTIIIETSFTNVSTRDCFFHFGYHPAFKIDAKTKVNAPKALPVKLNGKLGTNTVVQKNLMSMGFGKEYDTLVNKKINFTEVSMIANNLNIKVGFNSPNFQTWKPADAMFVCLEPWWGVGDKEKNAPARVEEKEDIIKVAPSKTFKAMMMINITKK